MSLLNRIARANLRERSFWTCFGILVLLAAAYAAVLAVFLIQDEVLDSPARERLAWHVAAGCWIIALPAIWLIARLESRWIARHVHEPHLEERITGQHQFAADAAHELQTPLTAQSLVGENALAHHASATELREAVRSMLEESKHMKRLIEGLLELTRASVAGVSERDADRAPMSLALHDLARGCVECLRMLAEEKSQRIDLTARPAWADVELTMIRQALLNVIHNAIEHCPEGARIHVETARFSRKQAMIRVTDDGPGIPLEQQQRVFERFYRGPGSRRPSLGLGLAIASALVKSQRGAIHLKSEPHEGCSFTLTLPASADASSPAGPLSDARACAHAARERGADYAEFLSP